MKRAFIAVTLATVGLVAPHARAVVAVAGPAAHLTGYATPVVVTQPGGPLTYANLDPLNPHDFVARDARRPNASAPWCVGYAEGACPLFWTELIGFGEERDVQGLEGAPIGSIYIFYCTIHPSMAGRLVIA